MAQNLETTCMEDNYYRRHGRQGNRKVGVVRFPGVMKGTGNNQICLVKAKVICTEEVERQLRRDPGCFDLLPRRWLDGFSTTRVFCMYYWGLWRAPPPLHVTDYYGGSGRPCRRYRFGAADVEGRDDANLHRTGWRSSVVPIPPITATEHYRNASRTILWHHQSSIPLCMLRWQGLVSILMVSSMARWCSPRTLSSNPGIHLKHYFSSIQLTVNFFSGSDPCPFCLHWGWEDQCPR